MVRGRPELHYDDLPRPRDALRGKQLLKEAVLRSPAPKAPPPERRIAARRLLPERRQVLREGSARRTLLRRKTDVLDALGSLVAPVPPKRSLKEWFEDARARADGS